MHSLLRLIKINQISICSRNYNNNEIWNRGTDWMLSPIVHNKIIGWSTRNLNLNTLSLLSILDIWKKKYPALNTPWIVVDLIFVQIVPKVLYSFVFRFIPKRWKSCGRGNIWKERSVQLEEEISRIRDTHQHEISALQDHHQRLMSAARGDTTGEDPSIDSGISHEETIRMKKEIESSKLEYEKLQTENQQLQASLEELDSQNQLAIEQILENKNKLQEQLSSAQKNNTSLEKDVEELKNKLSKLEEEREETNSDVENKLQEQLQNLKSENEKLLKNQENDKLQHEKVQSDLRQELRLLKSRCEEQQTLNHQLKQDLESASSYHQTANDDNQRLSQQMTTIKSSLKSFSHKLGVAPSNNNEEVGDVEVFVDQLSTKLSQMQLGKTEVFNNNKELKTKLEEKEQEYQKQRAACEMVEIENTKLQKTLEQMKSDLLSKEEKMKNILEDNKAQLKEATSQNVLLKEQLNQSTQNETQTWEKVRELEKKIHQLQCTVQRLEEVKKSQLEEVRKLASSHDVIAPEDVIEVIRDTLQEKETLQQQLTSAQQEVKDAQDLLETVENEKTDIEKECMELHDQLEELQCGERQQPEGAGAVRGLPTIQEEEMEEAFHNTGDQQEGKQSKENSKRLERICIGETEREEIGVLRAQIKDLTIKASALTEARTNLEMEVSSIKDERDYARQQLQEANHRLGNLQNLETEAVSLRTTNANLTEELAKAKESLKLPLEKKDDRISQLEGEISRLKADNEQLQESAASVQMLLFQKRLMEQRLLEADQCIDEYIEKVKYLEDKIETLQSHNVTTVYSDLEQDRCLELQRNLDTVRAQLIYKDDAIDCHKQALQNIAGLFDIEDASVDKVFSSVESEYAKLTEKLRSLEEEEEENDSSEAKSEGGPVGSKELEESRSRISTLETNLETLNNENKDLKKFIEDYGREIESLKKEKTQITEDYSKSKLELINDLEKSHSMKQKELSDLLESKSKDLEAALNEKDKLNRNIEEITLEKTNTQSSLQSRNSSLENEVLELTKSLNKLKQLELDLSNSKEEKDLLVNKLREESTSLSQQLTTLTSERTQMINALNQKHQENVSYHMELQKLSQLLTQERQKSFDDQTTLNKKLEEETSNHTTAKAKVEELSQKIKELQSQTDKHSQLESQIQEVKKDLQQWKSKATSAEQERDQLRVANASFNSQYLDQGKELSASKEKENQLSVELERLREHLVKVEETYTSEALRAEEREATLRATLTKLEDKLSNHSSLYNSVSQRANVQVETLQEQIQQLTIQRDDAINRLQVAEDNSDQNQQSLVTLQQVLQDFRKGQERDIAEATERERNKLQQQMDKNNQLEKDISNLKEQLSNKETALVATSQLQRQIDAYHRQIATLKAQVATQEQVMKKSQDEMALYKSSSEARVDKHLIRNLLVGYFATPSDKRLEVLHVIATVLDLSPEERVRTGLDTQGTSWLSSIANFLAPPATNVRVASKVDVLDHSSLSQAFVRFLEDESSPRPQAKLLAVEMAEQTQKKAESKAKSKAQSRISPLLPPVDDKPPQTSSPLLTGISTPPALLTTLSPVTGVSPSVTVPTATTTATTVVPEGGTPHSVGGPVLSTTTILSNLLGTDDNNTKTDDNANK